MKYDNNIIEISEDIMDQKELVKKLKLDDKQENNDHIITTFEKGISIEIPLEKLINLKK